MTLDFTPAAAGEENLEYLEFLNLESSGHLILAQKLGSTFVLDGLGRTTFGRREAFWSARGWCRSLAYAYSCRLGLTLFEGLYLVMYNSIQQLPRLTAVHGPLTAV